MHMSFKFPEIILIYKRKHCLTFLILIALTLIPVAAQKSTIRISRTDNTWQLVVNNEPFYIKGVVGNNYLEKIKDYGGNSIRTGWRQEQLDKAHQLGLYALVNLPAD